MGMQQREGEIVELPTAEAASLIKAGQAVAVESATVAPAENAMKNNRPQPRKPRP
jgi:hypothetical protein